MSLITKAGHIAYEPDRRTVRRERIVLLRDLTGQQCVRCGLPFPEEHISYCPYDWRDV